MKTTYHKDGSVTYWSVYLQRWVRDLFVDADELAAMSQEERAAVLKHTGQG